MKRIVVVLFFTCVAQFGFGQQDSLFLKNRLDSLSGKVDRLEEIIQSNSTLIEKQNSYIWSNKNEIKRSIQELDARLVSKNDSVSILISETRSQIENSNKNLGAKIQSTEDKTQSNISNLKQSLSQKTSLWVGGICFVLILTLVLFLILRKLIQSNDTKLMDKIAGARKSLEEETIKLDGKLIELLDKQLSINTIEKPKSSQNGSIKEPDHSLALKVADEIIRIQKNLSRMEDSIKGKKQLVASVSRIQSNFKANGYEIVDMLDKPYAEGLNASITFKPDENLKSGEQIITRIIKPQVNFNNIMVQPAQIEVSQGE